MDVTLFQQMYIKVTVLKYYNTSIILVWKFRFISLVVLFQEAPILTIFVGGNHEASGYLQELPYGGWVAPKIYYLGHASVVQFAGLRIAGLSGIFNKNHYNMGKRSLPYFSDCLYLC